MYAQYIEFQKALGQGKDRRRRRVGKEGRREGRREGGMERRREGGIEGRRRRRRRDYMNWPPFGGRKQWTSKFVQRNKFPMELR